MVIFRRFTAGLLALLLMAGLYGCAVKLPEGTQTTAPIHYPPHTCPADDPYVGMSREAFYANYAPACCLQEAQNRAKHGFLSGSLTLPG